ncbi:hypothetical protein Tco_1262262 [Tanacetum coccineum]
MVNSGLINRPQSLAQSNNHIDYEESGNYDNRSPNLYVRKPKKWKINLDDNVPGAHFCNPIKQNIKEQTKMWPSCDPNKKICDGGVEIYRVSKTGNLRFWYCNYDNERRNIKGKGLSFPDFLLAKYRKGQTSALVWDNRYTEFMLLFAPKKFCIGVAIATGRRGYYKPGTRAWVSRISRKIRIPIFYLPMQKIEYEVSDDDDSDLKSTARSVPKDYELEDTGGSSGI